MEFREFLNIIYESLYTEFLQLKIDVDGYIKCLKDKIDEARDRYDQNLTGFNKFKRNCDDLIKKIYDNAFKKVKELDKEWDELPKIIVPTQSLYEEVANYLKEVYKGFQRRSIAQPGSAHVWGACGRGFKSRHSDH